MYVFGNSLATEESSVEKFIRLCRVVDKKLKIEPLDRLLHSQGFGDLISCRRNIELKSGLYFNRVFENNNKQFTVDESIYIELTSTSTFPKIESWYYTCRADFIAFTNKYTDSMIVYRWPELQNEFKNIMEKSSDKLWFTSYQNQGKFKAPYRWISSGCFVDTNLITITPFLKCINGEFQVIKGQVIHQTIN